MAAQKPNRTLKTKPETVESEAKQIERLYYWQSPARPFKKRNREYFTTIGAIVFLLVIILFFLKEWLLIAVVISLMFVSYVLATVEPEKVEHILTNKGIQTGGNSYSWEEMDKFWFTDKWGFFILNIELKEKFPKKLLILVDSTQRKEVEAVVKKYLVMEVPEPTFMDKAAQWLSEKVPLES